MNALTLRSFVYYFITNTLSLLGTWVQKVGLGWLAWQITESTFWTSVVSLILMAPVGFLGPLIAVFAENWDSRRYAGYKEPDGFCQRVNFLSSTFRAT